MNPCQPCHMYPSMEARRLWQPSPEYLNTNEWSSGLFDCFLDKGSCARGLVIPCLNLAQTADYLDQNGIVVPFCASFGCFAVDLRQRVR